ncbi:hypothetical protein HDV00_005878 [Rhizophlyctis rosea]|nr:hypothetical protein HDV00_005878 [Rhizophlyctis rosea]
MATNTDISSFRRDFKDVELPKIPDEALEDLSRYTGEKDLQKLREHVIDLVQEIKKSHHTYACIANILFLEPRIQNQPYYSTFIQRQSPTTKTLEVGVCFGTDLRRYVQDGVAASSVTVADLDDSYWKFGGKLYRDEGKLGKIGGVKTVFGDFAGEEGAEKTVDIAKEELEGQFDFLINMLVLHVFSKNECRRFLARLFACLRSGGVLFGQCGGSTQEGPYEAQNVSGTEVRWRHTADSLKALLEELGFVDVAVQARSWEDLSGTSKLRLNLRGDDPTRRSLTFTATRP